jgi:diguanylate cyclase (GGDEF)-like protein
VGDILTEAEATTASVIGVAEMETTTSKVLTTAKNNITVRSGVCRVAPSPTRMRPKDTPEAGAGVEQRANEIRSNLRRIGRYNWSLWVLGVVIALALTVAVASLATAVKFDPQDPFYHFRMSQAVRGLVGMVLLFSVYTLYQQFQLMRTRQRLAEQIGISTEQHMLAEAYLELAMQDPLTGLHNRRYAHDRLIAEISRAQRLKSTLTVLMMDVDDLKQINDRWGHGTGDLALKAFGQRLNKAIRGSDLAARVGGDEFLVLLPDCDLTHVQNVLHRLSELEVQIDLERIAFGFSAGWTDYRPGETREQLLERADHALYIEKQSRKNQVIPVA